MSQKTKTLLGRGPKPATMEIQPASSSATPETEPPANPAVPEVASEPPAAAEPEGAGAAASESAAAEPSPSAPDPDAETEAAATRRVYDERTGTNRHTVPAPGWFGFRPRVDWPQGQIAGFNTAPTIAGPCSAASSPAAPPAPVGSPIEVRKTATGAMHLGPEANRTYTPAEAVALAREILWQFEERP